MRRVALRGLLARRTRLALTALAVALGVTLISGTYILTDTINKSFDSIFSASFSGTDVVITPDDSVQVSEEQRASLDEALVARAAAVDGVAVAEGAIFDGGGTFLGKDGEPFSLNGPKFVASLQQERSFGGFTYARGGAPARADELAIDKSTAEREGFRVGSFMGVQGETPRRRYKITGLTQVAGVDSYGGASVAVMTLAEAQRVAGKAGEVDRIDLRVAEGVDAEAVVAELRGTLPPNAIVRTGTQEASSQSADTREQLGFLTTALLAFAGISLFVGAFIIFNTFSITVAQRAREFALLRTLGASRGQVLRAVLAEGAVLGLIGSAIGLGLGILVAAALRALFKSFGFELPSTGSVILARTVYVSLGVGLGVTLISCLAPALRATRVPPVAALREGVALPETRSSRLATPLALVLTVSGVAVMAYGLFGEGSENSALSLLGGGAGAVFLGVALLSPRLVGPIAAVVGAPFERLFGITGRLARENTVRQPGRTAVTASALMVGVALMAFATIFASGAERTINDAIDAGLRGQAVVQNQDGFSSFSHEATEAAAGVPGVRVASALRFAEARVEGETVTVTGVEPATFAGLYETNLPPLAPGRVVIARDYAEEQGLAVGDTMAFRTALTKTVKARISGTVVDRGLLLGDIVLPNAVVERDFGQEKDALTLLGFQPGGNEKTVKAALDVRLKGDFPQTEALTAQEFKDDASGQVTQLLRLIFALLALAVIVSVFGIVNTLVLAITERTRELGMLRAIGTSRRQLRRMIRIEAVVTALIGGVLGIALGVVLAVLVTQPIDDFKLSIPVVALFGLFVGAGLAGVMASLLPARRAARLDVLDALAHT